MSEVIEQRAGARGKYKPPGTSNEYVCELTKNLLKDSNLAYVNLYDSKDNLILENISISKVNIIF